MDTKNQGDLINDEVTRILERMNELEVDSDEYAKAMKMLKDLREVQDKKRFKVSPDVIVTAAVGITEILLILNYEKLGVITSRAFSRLPRV